MHGYFLLGFRCFRNFVSSGIHKPDGQAGQCTWIGENSEIWSFSHSDESECAQRFDSIFIQNKSALSDDSHMKSFREA